MPILPIIEEMEKRIMDNDTKRTIEYYQGLTHLRNILTTANVLKREYSIPDDTMADMYYNAIMGMFPITKGIAHTYYHGLVSNGDRNTCKAFLGLVMYARRAFDVKEATDKDWNEWMDSL